MPTLFLMVGLMAGMFLAGQAEVKAAPPTVPVPLRLTETNIHDATLKRVEEGVWEIQTTGTDPYLFTEPISVVDVSRQHVLAFEYFSTTGTNNVQVFLDPPLREANSVTGPGLSRSEGWSRYALDLQPARSKATGTLRALRLDLGSEPGKQIQIRALQLRPLTPQEVQLVRRREARRASEKQRENRLRNYLDRVYPWRVTKVAVTDKQIKVKGKTTGIRSKQPVFLAEIPLWADVTEPRSETALTPLSVNAQNRFSVTLDRKPPKGEPAPNRLLSRWAVVRKTANGYELLSHARYPDTVQARSPVLPPERPRNKKGIGGLTAGSPLSDLKDLNLSAATVNIVLNGLFATMPSPGRTAFVYGGRTWYADNAQVARLDQTLLEAAKRHLVVSAIILIGQAGSAPDGSFDRLIAHPDADPAGIFVMPHVSSKEGVLAYAAALDFLAQRYSRADGRYGRIHHWILHNEINAGWVWTNAGEKTELLYMDLYQRSMRMAYLLARQYDPHAKVFISLEHHWTMNPSRGFYPGRNLLERLTEFSRAEGDFEWGIAFHPYPQNLFDPRVWADTEANFTFDTPKITFKNLEVLDAWVKQPRMLYQGNQVRTVHLSEQGLNSRDYSETALRDQAAGMAYTWNKFKDLSSIEVSHYHNWVDNRGEGGLRIGLRRFPDDTDDPLGRKPIWFVYESLGTAREEAVLAPYKSVVGIENWSDVRHTAPIPTTRTPIGNAP